MKCLFRRRLGAEKGFLRVEFLLKTDSGYPYFINIGYTSVLGEDYDFFFVWFLGGG